MSGLGRRLGRVEAVARARRAAADPVIPIPPLLLVWPGSWGGKAEAAYAAAEAVGDWDAMDDLAEGQMGHRPAPPGSGQVVVRVREVPVRDR